MFVGSTLVAITFMGGVYAILPAYEADLFGEWLQLRFLSIGVCHAFAFIADCEVSFSGFPNFRDTFCRMLVCIVALDTPPLPSYTLRGHVLIVLITRLGISYLGLETDVFLQQCKRFGYSGVTEPKNPAFSLAGCIIYAQKREVCRSRKHASVWWRSSTMSPTACYTGYGSGWACEPCTSSIRAMNFVAYILASLSIFRAMASVTFTANARLSAR